MSEPICPTDGLELQLNELGPLSRFGAWLFNKTKPLSATRLFRHWLPTLVPRAAISPEDAKTPDYARKRAAEVEYYHIIWLVITALFVVAALSIHGGIILIALAYLVGLLRVFEILHATVGVTLFDRISGRPDDVVASTARLLVLAFLNLIELVLWFGILYAVDYHRLQGAGRPATAFFLSAMTQFTIGYSNVHPTGYLRIVAAAQGLVAVVFLALVVARIVTSLPAIKPFRYMP